MKKRKLKICLLFHHLRANQCVSTELPWATAIVCVSRSLLLQMMLTLV